MDLTYTRLHIIRRALQCYLEIMQGTTLERVRERCHDDDAKSIKPLIEDIAARIDAANLK